MHHDPEISAGGALPDESAASESDASMVADAMRWLTVHAWIVAGGTLLLLAAGVAMVWRRISRRRRYRPLGVAGHRQVLRPK